MVDTDDMDRELDIDGDTHLVPARKRKEKGNIPADPTSETEGEIIEIGTDPEMVMSEIDEFTDDEDVIQDFQERQQLASDDEALLERLNEHHSLSPELSGGDLDAAWEDAEASGEETVGGSVVTPDQDEVDEIGKALGITYKDDEPLNTVDKLNRRDRSRWDLNPASMELETDADEETDSLDELLDEELNEDLPRGLDEEEEDELEEDLDDEFPDEIEDELDLDLDEEPGVDDIDEEDLEDEDDEVGYDLEDLDDEDLEDFLDDDFDADEDDDEDY